MQPPFDETRYQLKSYSNIFYVSLDPAGNSEIKVNDSLGLDRETLGDDIYLTVCICTIVKITHKTI